MIGAANDVPPPPVQVEGSPLQLAPPLLVSEKHMMK
jgi:hypothetical protein